MEHATESPATTTYESAITYDDETDCDTTPYTSPTL